MPWYHICNEYQLEKKQILEDLLIEIPEYATERTYYFIEHMIHTNGRVSKRRIPE